jgi:hypothetical protein
MIAGEAMQQAIGVHKQSSLVGFFAATAVNVVEALTPLPDATINTLLPFIVKGIASGMDGAEEVVMISSF